MSSHDNEVRIDAVLVKTPDADYSWVIVVGDAVAELVVRHGRRERLTVSPAQSDRVSEKRLRRILEELGVEEREAQILNTRFWGPGHLRDRLMFSETERDLDVTLNELFAYIGKSLAGMTL